MPSSLAKTLGGTLLSLQSLASNSQVISSALSVSAKFAIAVAIHFGRRATTALTTAVTFRLEFSPSSSGDEDWVPVQVFTTQIAAAESEAVSGTVAAGQNVVTVASTTNLTVGSIVYIDNPTIANSEWGRIKAVDTNVSVTLERNLTYAQTGATIYTQAEMFQCHLDLTAIGRLQLVVDGSGSGQAVAVRAKYSLADSVG